MTPLRAALLAVAVVLVPAAHAADRVEFNRDIRPILSDNCFACHGPDKNKRKAKLRLDDRENAVAKGAFIPGKPDESELVARVLLKEGEDGVMPPPAAHKKLTAAQKQLLRKWVEQGAEYQAHWAYTPLRRPTVPAVKGHTANPIDAVVLAELEKRRIAPSPPAEKRALVRRLFLDLLGVPPTPDEVEAFVSDAAPDAYERLVDRLLARPEYGERMTVPWLDLVRFADTVGYHGDQNQRIFPYRDYVLNAFNANKPFDQFTIEQLAGDLLPNPTTEQLVATGFNRLNMMTREGGAQPREYLAKYQADRVRTLGITWLGSTTGCCECHDHKFDPFTARDFYSLSAFFADVRQWGVYNDYNYTPNPDLKGWSNDHPFPPEIEVESPYLGKRVAKLKTQVAALAKQDKGLERWQKEMTAFLAGNPTGWATPTPTTDRGTVEGDRVLLTGKAVKGGVQTVTLTPAAGWLASVRLELLPHEKHNGKLTRDGAASTTVTLSLKREGKDGKESKLPLLYGAADRFEPIRYASTEPVLGLLGGWKTVAGQADRPHTAVWLLDKPVRLAEGDQLAVSLKSDSVGCVRVSLSPFGYADLNDPQTPKLDAAAHLLGTAYDAAGFARSKPLRKEIADLRGGRAWTQVTVAAAPLPVRLLPRGNWMDESGPLLQPAVPAFLPQPAAKDGRRLTRLDLAEWIVSKDNPLTARVFVNRLWKQLFGNGLSASVEDLGAQGDSPSHPELLDWLAVEFRDTWDVKRMVKLLILSNAYRQTSRARPELKEIDPNNRLLAYLSPRRLEAEFVRDNALAVAGLLNRDVGGPSARPYQPANYYANLQFPDRDYAADTDERQYRRGLYSHWQRTFLHPMLANFDAPSREECTAVRVTANTPQQALTLLNDPTFVEAARVTATRLLREGKTDAERLDRLFALALARPAKQRERESLLKFLAGQREFYAQNLDDAKKLLKVGNAPADAPSTELAAWASVCRVVLNLHETITRY